MYDYKVFYLLGILSCTSTKDSDTSTTTEDIYQTDTDDMEIEGPITVPANFAVLLDRAVELSLSEKQSLSNRDRILIQSEEQYLGITDEYEISMDGILETYDQMLSKTLYLISQEDESCYRFDSERHSVYSLDYDDSQHTLKWRNNWGYNRNADSAYLCFDVDMSNNNINAIKRYQFEITQQKYVEDETFTSQSVSYDSELQQWKLNTEASEIHVYDSGFDFSISLDFNPNNSDFVENERVSWSTLTVPDFAAHNLSGDKLYTDTHEIYQSQISASGDDASTKMAAELMLEQIQSDLEEEGSGLRYKQEVYLTFREAVLQTTLKSDYIVNGVVDQHTAPYVFFTNERDDSGVLHPFMVIATYSIADKPARLLDVAVPPGDGTTDSYTTQAVTRDVILQSYLLKIPLKNYGEVTDLTDNSLENSLADDVGETSYNNYNYASVSSIGVAVDGVLIYPALNNTLSTAQRKAEITNTGIHVGRGMGLHWHADGHSANGNGLNLYNLSDYNNAVHPPLIGFGFDGVSLFGTYEESYSSMNGYDVELDDFGGHTHGSYGYHYHTHTANSSIVQDSLEYTLHTLMKGAWKGNINEIPEFWKEGSPSVTGGAPSRYVGNAQDID